MKQQLGASQLAVVIEAHGMAVSTSIVDDDAVTNVNLWQLAVNGKLIVVLAERTSNVIYMVAESLFLASNGDVVICTIHSWAHEVGHAGIKADVILVGFLFMEHSGNK